MHSFEKLTVALSMLFACAGSACILIFSLTQTHQDFVLFSAVIATSISLALMLVGLFFILPATLLPARRTQFRFITVHPGAASQSDMPEIEISHNRPARSV